MLIIFIIKSHAVKSLKKPILQLLEVVSKSTDAGYRPWALVSGPARLSCGTA